MILMFFTNPVIATAKQDTIQATNIWANDWFYSHMQQGINEKWIDFSTNNFEPNKVITRAEFLIMLEKAMNITPNSEIANFLAQSSNNENKEKISIELKKKNENSNKNFH